MLRVDQTGVPGWHYADRHSLIASIAISLRADFDSLLIVS